jgi:hypothetical protein
MQNYIYIILVLILNILISLSFGISSNRNIENAIFSGKGENGIIYSGNTSKGRDTGGNTVGIIVGSFFGGILILYLMLFFYRE